MARIFISHSSRDAESAGRISAWLGSQGFEEIFLDFDKHAGIQPGADWERTLYSEVARSHAVILIVTANWHASRWCWSEFTQARALGKAIFPIIEAPTGETIVASDIQHLDLTSDRKAGLDQLARALEAIAREQHDFPWDGSRPPFPGLFAFQDEDAAIYFGRDDDIRRLTERLNARRTQGGARLIALLGASGSGKSSLLRAGLIPRIRRDNRNWIVLSPFRPGTQPLDEFCMALGLALGKPHAWRDVRNRLAREDARPVLANLARDLRANSGSLDAQILITIDQFEEIFSVAAAKEASVFLEVLSVALGDALPFIAVIALRSDYLGLLQREERLTSSFEEFSLKPMPLTRVSEVILGPARIAGLAVDDALVSHATADAATEDALPLLAFALRELYERFALKSNALTLDDYLRLGDPGRQLSSLENAVRQAADDVLLSMRPTEDDLKALRAAFVPQMVRVNDEGEYVRRAALWNDLPARAHPVLDRLAQARLLVVGQTGTEKTVEVAHEALLRKWPRLRGWIDEEREFLVGKNQLERSFEDWQHAEGLMKTEALLQGLQLTRARHWIINHAVGLSEAERNFIQESIAHANRMERKAFRQRAVLISSLFALAAIAVVGGPWAFGVASERRLVAREAARTDIRGEIISYATAPGALAMDTIGSSKTSPYTSALVQKLRQRNESLIKALTDVHQDVIGATQGRQRPFISTSMNGHIFVWQQPRDRTKRALIISVDDGGEFFKSSRLAAPRHDAQAFIALLRDAGFQSDEIVALHNMTKIEFDHAVQQLMANAKPERHKRMNMSPIPYEDWRGQPSLMHVGIRVPATKQVELLQNALVFVYFSGLGLSMSGEKYLVPDLGQEVVRDPEDAKEKLINVDQLVRLMSKRFPAAVFILDTGFPEFPRRAEPQPDR